MREGLIQELREKAQRREEVRRQNLEALNIEVRQFIAKSMLLIGADKIKEILRRLDSIEDMK